MRLILCILSLVSIVCMAADRDVLLEGCSSIPDAVKRASCFEALARMAPQPALSQVAPEDRVTTRTKKYEALNRAATAIHAAVDAGVSYVQYGPYVQQFSIELALVKQKSVDKPEEAAIDLFQRAADAYRDTATFWEASITFFSNSNNRSAFSGLPVRSSGTEWIANKYRMPLQSVDFFGLNKGVQTNEGIHTILQQARDYVADANTLLFGGSSTIARSTPIIWKASLEKKLYYNASNPGCADADSIRGYDLKYFIDEQSAISAGFKRSGASGC
jgi:hypothetical protein